MSEITPLWNIRRISHYWGQIIADPRDQIEINSKQITRSRNGTRQGTRQARAPTRKSPWSLLTHLLLMFPFRDLELASVNGI